MPAGRPSELDDELSFKIRTRILNGKKNKEIFTELEIDEDTWNGWMWRNYKSFRDNLVAWRAERFLGMAEENIPELLRSADEKVKNDMTKFVTSTAGKKTYSQRTEQTGAEGKDLPAIQLVHYGTKSPDTLQVQSALVSAPTPESH